MRKKSVIISTVLGIVLFSKSSAFSYDYYVVSQGDTLYSISKKTETPIENIINLNSLNNNSIRVGQKLLLKENASPSHIIVSEGDTLYSISKKYNVSFEKLVDMNNIKSPFSITLGQKIYLKKAGGILKKSESHKKNKANLNKDLSQEFIMPIEGAIISHFSEDNGEKNKGINIIGREGDFIRASKDGIVSYSGSDLKGFGKTVILSHKGGYQTIYSHNKSNLVMNGEKIKQGEKIATVGKTGKVDIPQLHFEIRKNGRSINPSKIFKK